MHIGLIGGIGVAATVVYYQRLTAAVEKLGGKLDLTIVHADVHELIKTNLADDRDTQAATYAKLLNRLRDAGCDCAAITSLGGHFCFDETVPLSPLPLVSAVTPLDDYFAAQGLETVGLLGTRVVMRTRLYGQLAKTRAIAPDDAIDLVGQTYQDMAVAGTCTPVVPMWVGGTLAGALIGKSIPDDYALDFAVPITFLALVAPMLRTGAHVAAAVVAVVLALLLAGLPYNLGLLVAALGGMMTGARIEARAERRILQRDAVR